MLKLCNFYVKHGIYNGTKINYGRLEGQCELECGEFMAAGNCLTAAKSKLKSSTKINHNQQKLNKNLT